MSDEHYTPHKYVELARQTMGGIDLDPCSNEVANGVVNAGHILTINDDCLSIENWMKVTASERPVNVFMNPPYSRKAGTAKPYVNKLISQWESGVVSQAIILLNNSTANKWWQPLWKFPHCFVSPRIAFLDQDLQVQDSPRYDNVFILLPKERTLIRSNNTSSSRFEELFSSVGHVTNLGRHYT